MKRTGLHNLSSIFNVIFFIKCSNTAVLGHPVESVFVAFNGQTAPAGVPMPCIGFYSST